MKYPEGGTPPWTHSKRGVHLLPAAYHGYWMESRGMYWVNLLNEMGISWVVLITDGDSGLERLNVPGYGWTTPAEFLLEHEITPIFRDGTTKFPKPYMNMEFVSRAEVIFNRYGMRPIVIPGNEPFDDREWGDKWLKNHGGTPPDANDPDDFGWVMNLLQERMSRVIENGGIAGFPDGPAYPYNPFYHLDVSQWEAGDCVYAAHNYGKGRPVNYPDDSVTKTGYEHYNFETGERSLLTWAEYMAYLDDLAYQTDEYGKILYNEEGNPIINRQWVEDRLEDINARRLELANPDLTAIQDDTCWRGWEKTLHWAKVAWPHVEIPMALTEGGWCPRDRAGTGPNTDIRWPHSTPKMVAKRTLEVFEGESPFFSICPWLLADDAMVPAGFVGWPYDSWVGWAYGDVWDQETGRQYLAEKPVVDALKRKTSSWVRVREGFERIIKVLG